MRRCALLAFFALGYAGYLLLGALVISAVERPYESRLRAELRELKAAFLDSSPCLPEAALERFLGAVLSANRHGVALLHNASAAPSNWDFASAFFFCSTLITTVGYGYTTPLSDAGKAFCLCYALLGVPFTMLVLTATVQRLAGALAAGPLERLALKWGCPRRSLSCGHLLLLAAGVLAAFFLVPAAVFSALEESWSYLDAFYFCFISLCTIGLGDYVPGEQPGQRYRPLYKICVTVYLLLGLLAMLLLLQTFHKAAELHGLSDMVLLPPEQPCEDLERILAAQGPPLEPEPAESTPVQAPLSAGGQANYASISR
ncbi:potassium channel subfamily K member 6-like isoform X4 [Eublepharis macularius]|uniref:Potassium channel subfamily K member n=1 Tax=Eublepharis macularius TaxID=481883 RepID=A0AA97KFZ2_EUBMA|nr:potassium channel subfamily K member 6-like isoform X4 [Eublepharis macularius]